MAIGNVYVHCIIMSSMTIDEFVHKYTDDIRHHHNPFRERYDICDKIMKRLYATYSSFSSTDVHIVHTQKKIRKDLDYLLIPVRKRHFSHSVTVNKKKLLDLLLQCIKLLVDIHKATGKRSKFIHTLHSTWMKLAVLLDMA